MKVCGECNYVEHWGTQCELVCPNCDEKYMQVIFYQKSACKSDSTWLDSSQEKGDE